MPFLRTTAHIFVSPGDAPAKIAQYVARMERQFNACQTPRSMYCLQLSASVFNSFPVIRTASAKNRRFYHAMRCISTVFAVMQCLSVRPSVRHVHGSRQNEIFLPSGSDTTLVFPYQWGCRYSDGNPPNGGVECKGVV